MSEVGDGGPLSWRSAEGNAHGCCSALRGGRSGAAIGLRGRSAYATTKALCDAAGWHLIDDELELGYLRYSMYLQLVRARRPLTNFDAESKKSPFAFVPLFYFKDYDKGRETFDLSFRALAEQLASFGAASLSGNIAIPIGPSGRIRSLAGPRGRHCGAGTGRV